MNKMLFTRQKMLRLSIICFCFIIAGCKGNIKQHDQKQVVKHKNMWSEYPALDKEKEKHIVLVSGDEEYRSEEALPQLAKILSKRHGFDCTVLYAQNPENPGIIDPNYSSNIPGLEKLKNADLLILFTRFRDLPPDQMKHIDDYLLSGKPLIGIRTATHAFNFKDKNHPYAHYGYNYSGPKDDWTSGFGRKVLGETWYTHHGHHRHQSTRGIIAKQSTKHPILNGIKDAEIWGPSDVYGIRDSIRTELNTIVLGQTIDRASDYNELDQNYGMKESDTTVATSSGHRKDDPSFNPNQTLQPIIWTKTYQLKNGREGKSLTSTIGASTDLLDEEVRRVFINGCYYLMGFKVKEKANVNLVGEYNPTSFAFKDDHYWDVKQIKVE